MGGMPACAQTINCTCDAHHWICMQNASDTATRRDPRAARRFAQQGLKQKSDINEHFAAPHASLDTTSVQNVERCLRKQPASDLPNVSQQHFCDRQHSSIPQQGLHCLSGKMGASSEPKHLCTGPAHQRTTSEEANTETWLSHAIVVARLGSSQQLDRTTPM